jgi:hypothetical protein
MNWEGVGRKWLWHNEELSQNFIGLTEENLKKPQSITGVLTEIQAECEVTVNCPGTSHEEHSFSTQFPGLQTTLLTVQMNLFLVVFDTSTTWSKNVLFPETH